MIGGIEDEPVVRIYRYVSPGGYSPFDSMVPNSKFLVEVTEDESAKDRTELDQIERDRARGIG